MSREVYLIRYPSHPFKDHWGLWIPSTTNEHVGTIIHVEGDVRNGFTHGVKRSYDLREDSRAKRFDLLGRVPAGHVHDDSSSDGEIETFDTDPRDDIERTALSIPAPGPSMNSATNKTVRTSPSTTKAFHDIVF